MLTSYPWQIARWRDSRTRARLSLAERGLFREILDLCFHDGSVPNVDGSDSNVEKTLTRLVGCTEREFKRYWPSIRALLIETEEGELTHPVVRAMLPELLEFQDRRRKKSSEAANARWERERAKIESRAGINSDAPSNATSNAASNAQAMLADAKEKEKEKEKEKKHSHPLVVLYASRMHSRHPPERRGATAVCRKHLGAITVSLKTDEQIEERLKEIDARHEGWCEYWKRDENKYAKGLENWLAPTMGRYEEDPPALIAPMSAEPQRTVYKRGDYIDGKWVEFA